MPPRFHTLAITAANHDTADAMVLTFAVPTELAEDYAFTPGQYLTLRHKSVDHDIRRSYSICSGPTEPLSVAVKRIPGGKFSELAMGFAEGDELEVMTPEGRFLAPTGGQNNHLLLAAGSGITPMMSIAKTTLENEPDSIVTLCYANRSTDSVMFKEDLENLKDQFMNRFLLTHVMDEEKQDVALFNGRLDQEKLETLATRGLIDPPKYTGIYICGPQPMIEAAAKAMENLGADPCRIKFELFTPPGGLPTASATPSKVVNEKGAKVTITVDGASRSFHLDEGAGMVDAAAKAGLEFPYSCNNGMCATCRCKLVEGDAEMRQNFSLEQWEMNAGFVLACQVRPLSDEVSLDFDAV
ncbi:putative ferredoxin reductase electron transfer component protein [Rhodobacterales bacterium HTCC2150]|nr:putative ferredoxin reductase electron transfer component protein [Rhodobacterales bacterium HTCC2150] [Rhodobacteraceae bacterium HTCC2150]